MSKLELDETLNAHACLPSTFGRREGDEGAAVPQHEQTIANNVAEILEA